MVSDWIEAKTLPVARLLVARLDRRAYDVVIRVDSIVVNERPSGIKRSFYLLHQLKEFCLAVDASRRPPASRRRGDAGALPWRGRWQPRAGATADELKNEVGRLHETIAILRGKRRQTEAERDRWERLARDLEAELSVLRGFGLPAKGAYEGSDKFRRAKKVVARLTHPDATGATGVEATIREKLFKEFWAEFERIEAER
jgi:hypothetical protein